MSGNSAKFGDSTCPNCEFEQRLPGDSTPVGNGIMLCGVCDTRWRAFQSGARSRFRNKQADARILKPVNTIDNRVFGKNTGTRTQSRVGRKPLEPSQPTLQLKYHPQTEKSENPFRQISNKFYLIAATIPVIALCISFAISQSGSTGIQNITLSEISMTKQQSRQGIIATIRGKLANSSGKSQPAPDLQLVLLGKDGQKLRSWRYSPPVSLMAQSSSLVFETTVGNVPGSAQRIEITLSDRIYIAQR